MSDMALVLEYFGRGMKCSWMGHAVVDMDRMQLVAFIGALDELIELERKGEGPTRSEEPDGPRCC